MGEAERLLEELLDAHLLDQQRVGRYTFHDLLRAFAAGLAQDEETGLARAAAVRRMVDYYLRCAHAAGSLAYASHSSWPRLRLAEPRAGVAAIGLPDDGELECGLDGAPARVSDREQALAWYGAEYPVLVCVVGRAAVERLDTEAWQLAAVISCYLLQAGLWRELLAVNEAALAAGELGGDRLGQAYAHHWLGQLHRSEGRHLRAHEHLRQALGLFRGLGELVAEGQALLDIALTYGEEESFPAAVEYSRRGLELFRRVGDAVGLGRALNSVGWYLCMLGEYAEALDHCERALAFGRHAATLDSIGYIYLSWGDHRQALRFFTEALEARRAKGDYFLQAHALTMLGDTRLAMGDAACAEDLWRQALAILDHLGHRDAAGVRERIRGVEGVRAPGSSSPFTARGLVSGGLSGGAGGGISGEAVPRSAG